MIMANFDPNRWQQITIASSSENTGSSQSMDGSVLYTKDGRGSVFFGNTNLLSGEQLWQIFAFNSSYYVLRTKGSGPQGYMGAGLSSDESTQGKTVPGMANSSVSDDSMFWKISPWGDGTFFFTNAANGSAWHLTLKSNSLMAMTSNITAPQNGQRFNFTQLGTIDDARFSSVIVSFWYPDEVGEDIEIETRLLLRRQPLPQAPLPRIPIPQVNPRVNHPKHIKAYPLAQQLALELVSEPWLLFC